MFIFDEEEPEEKEKSPNKTNLNDLQINFIVDPKAT
jgi:hypothetical protein